MAEIILAILLIVVLVYLYLVVRERDKNIANIQTEIDTQYAKLNAAIDVAKTNIATLQSQLTAAEAAITAYKSGINTANTRISDLVAERDAIAKTYANEYAKLAEIVEAAKTKITELIERHEILIRAKDQNIADRNEKIRENAEIIAQKNAEISAKNTIIANKIREIERVSTTNFAKKLLVDQHVPMSNASANFDMPVSEGPWHPMNPDGANNNESCLHMLENGLWNDVHCSEYGSYRGLCRRDNGEMTGTTGKYFGDQLDEMTDDCTAQNATFWRPTNATEFRAATELAKRENTWFWLNPGQGIYNIWTSNRFDNFMKRYDTVRKPISITDSSWMSGHPTFGGEAILTAMIPSGVWVEMPASKQLHALCAFPDGSFAITNNKYAGNDLNNIISECVSRHGRYWRPISEREMGEIRDLVSAISEPIWINSGENITDLRILSGEFTEKI